VSGILCWILTIYLIIMFVRVLSTWFRVPPSGPMSSLMSFVFAVTEPVMRPLRGVMPPVRMGMVALDLSPIIIFIVIGILRSVVCTG
jgi:YggT family protein